MHTHCDLYNRVVERCELAGDEIYLEIGLVRIAMEPKEALELVHQLMAVIPTQLFIARIADFLSEKGASNDAASDDQPSGAQ